VAEAYIDNLEDKSDVNHIDGDKSNNDISNLEWATHSENIQKAYDNGQITKQRSGWKWGSPLGEKVTNPKDPSKFFIKRAGSTV
jgi:hypothetical protein